MTLEALYEQIRSCTDCDLCKRRTNAVPGEGPPDSELMFVGEGPGFNEDQQGRPFVGAAGKFLESMLGSIGYRRSDVYITNVVKCRPPENRDPLPSEIDACRHYLEQQIALIRPQMIVTLGRFSLSWFFPRDAISKVHGQLRQADGKFYMHMYHPAAALHAGNLRRVIEEDFSRIPIALEKVRSLATAPSAVAAAEAEPAIQQGRLF